MPKGPPKTPYKLWGGRFEKSAGEALQALSHSVQFDYRLASADILGTKAYAQALQAAGILTPAEASRAADALDALGGKIEKSGAAYFRDAAEEDVHTFILARLREQIGGLADKLHTGRSRNEQVALDFRIWLRRTAAENCAALRGLMAALLQSAEKHAVVILPGYTHLRRAQPVLWPHFLLAYFEMFRRDHQRLEMARRSAGVMPLGSGALAGTGFALDRRRLATELGFPLISANSMDAVSDRDFALEYLFAATLCFLHLSRMAEDWILYSSEEFGFLELGDEVSTGSSLMPQKKNPDSLELIRGKTGRVLGHLVSLATALKGLPLTYNRDLQEDKEPVFDAAAQLQLALPVAAEVVATTALRPEKMETAASDGWLCATDLAEFLAGRGVPFHEAHAAVGRLVLESVRAGKQPRDCGLEDLRRYAPQFDRRALALLSPQAGIARRGVPGGTAPAAVRRALREAQRWLGAASSGPPLARTSGGSHEREPDGGRGERRRNRHRNPR